MEEFVMVTPGVEVEEVATPWPARTFNWNTTTLTEGRPDSCAEHSSNYLWQVLKRSWLQVLIKELRGPESGSGLPRVSENLCKQQWNWKVWKVRPRLQVLKKNPGGRNPPDWGACRVPRARGVYSARSSCGQGPAAQPAGIGASRRRRSRAGIEP